MTTSLPKHRATRERPAPTPGTRDNRHTAFMALLAAGCIAWIGHLGWEAAALAASADPPGGGLLFIAAFAFAGAEAAGRPTTGDSWAAGWVAAASALFATAATWSRA